eukprot:5962237-Alexandrium_andersonii.AAC.1
MCIRDRRGPSDPQARTAAFAHAQGSFDPADLCRSIDLRSLPTSIPTSNPLGIPVPSPSPPWRSTRGVGT